MSTRVDGAIVLGVDDSVLEGEALRWSAEQAHLEGRRLVLANASGPVSGAWREYGEDLPRDWGGLRQRADRLLDRALEEVQRHAPGVGVDELFEVTDPQSMLIGLSAWTHMLVLGSRGRGAVRSHLLGSVGLAVVRHAACPVVVHRPGRPGRAHHGVVVAAEATKDSIPVLAFAFRQASLRRLPLRVVHYVYDARSALVGASMTGDLRDTADDHARALAESLAGLRQDFPDVYVTVETPRGTPGGALPALTTGAELTVVGRHQRSLVGRLLAGSVSGSLVEHAHGPVAVVPVARAD